MKPDREVARQFSDIVGKTFDRVYQSEVFGNDAIIFETEDCRRFGLYHRQDCCENVSIESIVGDLEDLQGTPILLAEEACNEDPNANESATWTFYKLATIHGYVDIRFYGESNGYYSESVDFFQMYN
jgi:hypothetical protein